MKYQPVSQVEPATAAEARAAALAWLEQRLRFEAWLDRVREPHPPRRGSGLAAAA